MSTFKNGRNIAFIRTKMYGMLLESIQHYVKEIYGEEIWNKIRALAGVENRVFVTHHRYSDDLFLKLAGGAAEVVGKEKGWKKKDFMRFFGNCFVKFFSNYSYDRIVRVTGRTLGDFLNSIDNIHEQMRFGYPKMESPSFYCEDETSSGLSLHYLSKRKGFKYYVIGQIEQVVREFFPMEIEITVISHQQTTQGTHVIYRLNFDNQSSKPFIPKALSSPGNTVPEWVSLDNFFEIFPFGFVISRNMTMSMAGSYILATLGDSVLGADVCEMFSLRRPKVDFTWENLQRNRVVFELISKVQTKPQSPTSPFSDRCQDPFLKGYPKSTWDPPHDVIDSGYHSDDKESTSLANSVNVKRVNKLNGFTRDAAEKSKDDKNQIKHEKTRTKNGLNLLSKTSLSPGLWKSRGRWDLRTASSSSSSAASTDTEKDDSNGSKKQRNLHLKGQMKYIASWGKILFVCSPVISDLDEMIELGVYMSDLGIYDRSQEMVLSGIKPLPQLEYARDQLIDKSTKLEENLRKLEEERQRSDELLYSMLPRPVADRLKNGAKPIDTCEYFESVTVLFSYLDGFVNLCSRVDAMEVVTLVNRMFVDFDNLSEKYDVYKFETLGDAVYMAVSGAPVRKMRHAEPMAAMALAMLDSMTSFLNDIAKDALSLSIGMHSGSTAAGIVGQKMPQYCLFGDTVNIAARLRTTSLPMRIHISDSCNACLKGTEFQTEFRGYMMLKGLKEEMKTHWLIGRKEEIWKKQNS